MLDRNESLFAREHIYHRWDWFHAFDSGVSCYGGMISMIMYNSGQLSNIVVVSESCTIECQIRLARQAYRWIWGSSAPASWKTFWIRCFWLSWTVWNSLLKKRVLCNVTDTPKDWMVDSQEKHVPGSKRDGHQPNSRGLYTYIYIPSIRIPIKGGMTIPNKTRRAWPWHTWGEDNGHASYCRDSLQSFYQWLPISLTLWQVK